MAAITNTADPPQDRHRATALQHARMIQDKKDLKTRVADLVLEAYDLPTSQASAPSDPAPADLHLFKECLCLFQPSDLEDLIHERNIDDRCGYALCPEPNRKARHNGEKVWNRKGGKDFQLLDRHELERWCSQECAMRGTFVKAQLGTEPAWLREDQVEVRVLDESAGGDLSANMRALSMEAGKQVSIDSETLASKMRELALERGDPKRGEAGTIEVVERADNMGSVTAPSRVQDAIEGFVPKRVTFSELPHQM